MYLGAVTASLLDCSLSEVAQYFAALGLKGIEPGAGGFFPKTHCNPRVLLDDERARDEFMKTLKDAGLRLTALAVHGEPLHPDPKIAQAYREDFRAACELAGQIGVDRLTLLAGLPEAAPGDMTPNWILFPFPPRNVSNLEYQWEQRLIPYWREQAQFAADHGVRLCFEMVPGDMVYQPSALLRLREAVGPTVGCNFDPSHLFYMGVDIEEAIMTLGKAIYHVHAKDARMHPWRARVDGTLDAGPFAAHERRAWSYRAVGHGHDLAFWRGFASALRMVGYDDAISIEHEDLLIEPREGFEIAVRTMQEAILHKPLPAGDFMASIGADA